MIDTTAPIGVFSFDVRIQRPREEGGPPSTSDDTICSGSFSECSGLEANLEPRVIREGGRNYGVVQRAGRVTFGTVVLRRGITQNRDLWRWFELFARQGRYTQRIDATITVKGPLIPDAPLSPRPEDRLGGWTRTLWTWKLVGCLPVKFKAPDLNATSAEVGIEELHLAHEGMTLEQPEDERGSEGAQ